MAEIEEKKEPEKKDTLPPWLEKIKKSQPTYLWVIEIVGGAVIVGYLIYSHFNTQATQVTHGTGQGKHHRAHSIRIPVKRKNHQHQHHQHKHPHTLMEEDGNVGGIGGGYMEADVEQGETSVLHHTHPANSHKMKAPIGTNELPLNRRMNMYPGGIEHISGQDFYNEPDRLASTYPWELMTDGQGGGSLYG